MMMEEILMAVEMLGEDADVWEANGVVHVTLNDFVGFDDDWNEIVRDFDDADAVEDFLDSLESAALRVEGDFYQIFYFDGFSVVLGYASYDA